MTDTELLDTLAELDRKATVSACSTYICDNAAWVDQEERGAFCMGRTANGQPDIHDANLVAFALTHRARLLELARKGLRSGGVE